MLEPDLIEIFVQPLNRARVRYIISGSVAAMLYGEPRVTHDIDLVVFLRSADAARLAGMYPEPAFYVPPPEAILQEFARERGHFNILHVDSGLKADLYLAGRDELHAWAFARAQSYTVGAEGVTVAPPEYVILRKLEYYREGGSDKHLRDIRSILAVSGEQLDRLALSEWSVRLRVESEWRKANESL